MKWTKKTKLYNIVYGIILILMISNIIMSFVFLKDKEKDDITIEILIQETLITIGFLLLSIHHFYNTFYLYGFIVVFIVFVLRLVFLITLYSRKYVPS